LTLFVGTEVTPVSLGAPYYDSMGNLKPMNTGHLAFNGAVTESGSFSAPLMNAYRTGIFGWDMLYLVAIWTKVIPPPIFSQSGPAAAFSAGSYTWVVDPTG
jgi:hypothetical protein